MLLAEKMDRVSIVVLKEDMEDVLADIARMGVFHLIRIEDLGEWAKDLPSADAGQLPAEYAARQRGLRALIEQIDPDVLRRDYRHNGPVQGLPLETIDEQMAKITADLAPLQTACTQLADKLE